MNAVTKLYRLWHFTTEVAQKLAAGESEIKPQMLLTTLHTVVACNSVHYKLQSINNQPHDHTNGLVASYHVNMD